MNIHPAFVHFPIALLMLWAVIELMPLVRLWPSVAWDSIKKFLLGAGTVSVIPTIATGLIAAGGITGITGNVLLQFHMGAAFSVLIIAVLASTLTFFVTEEWGIPGSREIAIKALALLEIVALFIVGALGAAMVYGFEVDPIVNFITWILGLQ